MRYLPVAAAIMPGVLAGIHEKIHAVPKGWAAVGKSAAVSSSTEHVFTIALNRENIGQLESHLLSVSTPKSPGYGNWIDIDDINSAYGPASEAAPSVTRWLEQNGISKYHVEGAFIDFATDVDTVNNLLNASYTHYTNNAGATKLRTLSYSVPDEIQDYIALIDPSTYFGNSKSFVPTPSAMRQRTKRTAANSTSACQKYVTPDCLKELYNIGDYQADIQSGSRIGFGSFLNESAVKSDLAAYEKFFNIPEQSFTVTLVAGGVDDQDPNTAQDGEANLDAQNQVGIAHPLPVEEFITGGSPPFVPTIDQPLPSDNQNEPYVPYFRYLLEQPNSALPQVISNSYGDQENSVPYAYARLACDLIGLMGLRGITIIESSGDLGVGAGCKTHDNRTQFDAIFPATCPYLTSVGGTVAVSPEKAWDGSSGGFSSYFSRPSYQDVAVSEYLGKHISPDTLRYYSQYTNFKGRGFPDVSAHSVSPDYIIFAGGRETLSGGTSAAAPVWAGIVGLLNDARLRAGKPRLGWLNPLLYAFGSDVLIDITLGSSVGCNGQNTQSGEAEPAGSGIVPWAEWNATAGWDPVTGFGTPDFQKLKELVLSF